MILKDVKEIKPGLKLAKSIYNDDGELLLSENVIITNKILDKLKEKDIPYVYINDGICDDIIPEEDIDDTTRREAEKGINKNFSEIEKIKDFSDMTITDIKTFLSKNKNILGKSFDSKIMQKTVENIIEPLLTKNTIVNGLGSIKNDNNYEYKHSVDVTIMAIILAKKLGFNKEDLNILALGSLMHNIGMTLISKNIFKNKGKLKTKDIEIVNSHAELGFEIVKDNYDIKDISKVIILQHHERQDGYGYPQGLKSDNCLDIREKSDYKKIHRFAEIVSICDSYDSMLSNKFYKNRRNPEEVLKIMRNSSGTRLNREMFEVFANIINIYPVASQVIITNSKEKKNIGCKGIIAKKNEIDNSRPEILVFTDTLGIKIRPYIIRMTEDINLKIKVII